MPTATVTIDAPIADVFALLADMTTHPTWSPDVLSGSQLGDGPVGLGTRFQLELKGPGESEQEITEYDEPTRVQFSGRTRMGDTRHRFFLTPEGERTRVDQVLEMRPQGLWRLLAPVMAMMMKKGVRENAAGLESYFEGSTKAEADITVYGTHWCSDCRRATQFFREQHVAYEWIDVDRDPEGLRYVREVNDGRQIIPTIVFQDGSTLVEPSNAELAAKLRIST